MVWFRNWWTNMPRVNLPYNIHWHWLLEKGTEPFFPISSTILTLASCRKAWFILSRYSITCWPVNISRPRVAKIRSGLTFCMRATFSMKRIAKPVTVPVIAKTRTRFCLKKWKHDFKILCWTRMKCSHSALSSYWRRSRCNWSRRHISVIEWVEQ